MFLKRSDLSCVIRPASAAVPAGRRRRCTEGSTAGSSPASAGSSASPLCSAPPSSENHKKIKQQETGGWRRGDEVKEKGRRNSPSTRSVYSAAPNVQVRTHRGAVT